jgi:16S rRNA (cytosine967-C5)-methyltransferase
MTPRAGTGAGARATAARVIAQVLVEGRYLDAALEQARARHRALAPGDWSLVQELSYGTLRWYHQLAGIAALLLQRPLGRKDSDVQALLLVGLYQLRHLRMPDYAAVGATVAAAELLGKPWAKALLNACLRRSRRDAARQARAVADDETLRYSHPSWLIAALRRDHPEAWERVLLANNQRPPMSLRVNRLRVSREDYAARLVAHGIGAHAHARAPSALVLEAPCAVETLPGFDAGLVSVQDAAAQLAAGLLDPQPGERVLDACAAPGGKTAHLLECQPRLAELTALDIDAARLERLRANLERLGLRARVLAGDAGDPTGWWDGRPYDRILLDAPCSATGVIRRHPDIKTRRRPEDLDALALNQARLLDGVWSCLAPGGKLLYATCSVLRQENERQVGDFLTRHRDATPVPIGSAASGCQILPGEEEMDGFYYALLRKS